MSGRRQGLKFTLVAALSAAALCASPAGGAAHAAETAGVYKLGSGDKVRVITYGEDFLTGEFYVSSAGKVSLPLVGEQQASGLTTSELASEIVSALVGGGYIKDPRVSVEVLNFRPFYILGEVNKAGAYPFEDDMTVLNAVATANGFTYRANEHRVWIKHAGEAEEHEIALTPDLRVKPGDTIRVKGRMF
jgi:polysaccharide export outer membrane protein